MNKTAGIKEPETRSEPSNKKGPANGEQCTPEGDLTDLLDLLRSPVVPTVALCGLFAMALALTLYFGRAVFIPVVAAVFFNLLLGPIVQKIHRAMSIPYAVVAGVLLLTLSVTIGYGLTALMTPALQWANDAPTILDKVKTKLSFISESAEKIDKAQEKLEDAVPKKANEPLEVEIEAAPLSQTLIGITGNVMSGVLACLLLLFYMLAAGDSFLKKLVETMPTFREKRAVVGIVQSIEESLSRYFLTITSINALLGVAVGTSMALIGVPNPALWGVMAFILNYIPYVGPFVGVAVIALVSVATFDNIGYALMAPSVYFLWNCIEGSFVTPYFLGCRLALNPVIIILWLLVFGFIWGIPGALLAVPMLAAAKTLCDNVEPLHPVAKFLGETEVAVAR